MSCYESGLMTGLGTKTSAAPQIPRRACEHVQRERIMRRLGSAWRPVYCSLLLLSFFFVTGAASAQMAMTTSPTSVNFGNVQVGSSPILPVTITNTGKSSLTISATVSGSGFRLTGPNLPITIAPQQPVSLSVAFSPQAAGSASGTLTVETSASWGGHDHGNVHTSNAVIPLSGTGYTAATPGFLSTPLGMNLGSTLVGTPQTKLLTLTNSGGTSLQILSAHLSSSTAGFSVSGLTFPYTLAAGASASLSVVFAPTVAGTASATLTLSSDASNPSVAVALSGSATTATGTLALTPVSMSFGTVTVGTTKPQNGSLTASGGSVTLSSASSSNSQFTLSGLVFPVIFAAGQIVPFTVTFAPTAAATASAKISFLTSSSSSISETASGTGAATPGFLSTPLGMNLGSTLVGTPQTKLLTLTNSGGTSLQILSAHLSSSTAGFSVSGLTFPYTLAAGASASLSVVFAPTVAGTASATLTLSSDASNPSVAVALSGSATTATGTLALTPVSMSFGTVTVGTTKPQNGSLTASGGSVTLSSASSSNSQFTLSGLAFPVTIAAGQIVPFTVTFAPTAAATASAKISFLTSSSSSISETASG